MPTKLSFPLLSSSQSRIPQLSSAPCLDEGLERLQRRPGDLEHEGEKQLSVACSIFYLEHFYILAQTSNDANCNSLGLSCMSIVRNADRLFDNLLPNSSCYLFDILEPTHFLGRMTSCRTINNGARRRSTLLVHVFCQLFHLVYLGSRFKASSR